MLEMKYDQEHGMIVNTYDIATFCHIPHINFVEAVNETEFPEGAYVNKSIIHPLGEPYLNITYFLNEKALQALTKYDTLMPMLLIVIDQLTEMSGWEQKIQDLEVTVSALQDELITHQRTISLLTAERDLYREELKNMTDKLNMAAQELEAWSGNAELLSSRQQNIALQLDEVKKRVSKIVNKDLTEIK